MRSKIIPILLLWVGLYSHVHADTNTAPKVYVYFYTQSGYGLLWDVRSNTPVQGLSSPAPVQDVDNFINENGMKFETASFYWNSEGAGAWCYPLMYYGGSGYCMNDTVSEPSSCYNVDLQGVHEASASGTIVSTYTCPPDTNYHTMDVTAYGTSSCPNSYLGLGADYFNNYSILGYGRSQNWTSVLDPSIVTAKRFERNGSISYTRHDEGIGYNTRNGHIEELFVESVQFHSPLRTSDLFYVDRYREITYLPYEYSGTIKKLVILWDCQAWYNSKLDVFLQFDIFGARNVSGNLINTGDEDDVPASSLVPDVGFPFDIIAQCGDLSIDPLGAQRNSSLEAHLQDLVIAGGPPERFAVKLLREADSISVDKNPIPPGQTARVTVEPNYSERSFIWSISQKSGTARAEINGDTSAVISDVSGDGWMTIRAVSSDDPSLVLEGDVQIGCSTCSSSSGQCDSPGNGNFELSSIEARFGLGKINRGAPAGNIFLRAETPAPENATPNILEFSSLNKTVTALYDGSALRQVISSEAFVNIEIVDNFSYNINFYRPDDKGSKVGEFYEVEASALPFVTWTVENPDKSTSSYNTLRLSQLRGGNTTVYEYIWDENNSTWSLSKGNGLQIHTKQTQAISGGRIETEIIKDNLDVIASKTQTTWHTYDWGDEIIEKVVDPDGADLTTTYDYYNTPGENGYAHIKSQINPDGSWERYEYNDQNRKTVQISSWQDAPAGTAAASARAVYYNYTLQDAADTNEPEDVALPRLVIEEIEGTVVSKSYYVFSKDPATGERTEIVKQCVNPAAAYNDPTNLSTITVTYPQNDALPESGKTKSITYPDGRLETHSWDYGTYTSDVDPSIPGTFLDGTGTDVREIIVHGTITSPQGIANKTVREIRIQNHVGDELLSETQVYTGSGYERIHYTTKVYDADGHVTDTYQSNGHGTHSEAAWDCCNKTSETDEQGIVTTYPDYDGLGRLLTATKIGVSPYPNISTSYTYDAVGRALVQTITAGTLSLATERAYDMAGRLDHAMDHAGLTTDYEYSPSGLMDTVTHPGGATEITERYVDGRVKSVTGTSVVPQYYTYGVNTDGTQWTQINTASHASPMWEKTTTDMLGRVVKVEKPGYSGTESTQNFYNTLGQLERTSTTGMADTLYGYDELGSPIKTALDMDANASLDPGSMDRVNETETLYVYLDTDWWQQTIQKVYAADNDATPTTVSTQRIRLSGLGTGGLVGETVSIDTHGNQTISTVAIDRAAKTETRSIDYPDSSIDAVSQTVNGLLTSTTTKTGVTMTYGYDDLGRRIAVTDPRTGAATIHYDSNGRMEYEEDAAGNRTTFTYEQDTGRKATETNAQNKVTRYLYNTRGQVTNVWGDATYPIMYEYDSYGRIEKLHTYRGGTSWHLAMWPTGNTGLADTTTWHYQEATGMIVSKEYADGKSVSYTYEPGGKLDVRTWARLDGADPLQTDYDYDPNTGDLTDIDYSDSTPDIGITYDRLGRQKTVTDAVGSRTFTYNTALQLESETITGLYNKTITRTYETTGVMGRSTGFNTGAGYSITHGYDSVGRFNMVAWSAEGSTRTTTYTYVPNSDLIQQLTTDNGQKTTFTYETNRNLKTQVKNELNSQLISQYDYQYDTLGRRISVVNTGLAFAKVANAFSRYEYNDRNELINSARYLGANINDLSNPVQYESRNYSYDPIGNRTQAIEDTMTLTYVPNTRNQYSQITTDNGQPTMDDLLYDDSGNLTTATLSGSQKTLTYNAENRLVSIEPTNPAEGDKKLEFQYDYMGRRVKKKAYTYSSSSQSWELSTQSLFVYDGWNMIQDLDSGGTVQKAYVWGLDLSQSLQGAGGIGGLLASIDPADSTIQALDLDGDNDIDGMDADILAADPGQADLALFAKHVGKTDISAPVVHCYFYDANGNVGQLIKASDGSIAAHYEYDPFGNIISKAGSCIDDNPFRFSTKYFDQETSLYYYGYRYYSAELGRWINRDPIGETGGKNVYVFLNNDVLMNIDPLGLEVITTVVHYPDGSSDTYIVYEGTVYGYILKEQEYRVPSYWHKTRNMIVKDYHVTVFGKGNRRILSDIIIEDGHSWFNTEKQARLKQGLSLLLSFGAPLKKFLETPSKIVTLMEYLDNLDTTISAGDALIDKGLFNSKFWVELLGYVPYVGTAKAATDILIYDSKSLDPFDRVETNGFYKSDEIIDLTCELQKEEKITDEVISKAILEYHKKNPIK